MSSSFLNNYITLHNKMDEFVNSGGSNSFSFNGVFLTPYTIWFNPIAILRLMEYHEMLKPESYNALIKFLDDNKHLAKAANKTDFFGSPLYTTRTLYSKRAGWKAKIASILTNKIIA